jgi:hypothetical protein
LPDGPHRPGRQRVLRDSGAEIGQNDPVGTQGKRAGSRRGPKKQAALSPGLLGLAVGVTLAVVAWGYLVYAAIDFGASARGGDARAWWFLAVASLGAVSCLFIGLMLVARLLRRFGITGHHPATTPALPEIHSSTPIVIPAPAPTDRPAAGHRPAGGRRASR